MFNSSNCGYSLADIAAATGGNNRNGGFGNDGGAWWIIILFLFCFMGWGDEGMGGGRSSGGSTTRAAVGYGFDFQNLDNQVRGVQQGLCDGFYAMNTGMLNGFCDLTNAVNSGFHGVDNAICTLGYQTQQGFSNALMAGMQNTNAITAQLTNIAAQNASCCCETQRQIERGFCDVNYNLATQSCQTRQAICDSTRDIIDNQNAGVRSILEFLTQDKIANLQAENQALKLTASQQAQNAYLISQLGPKTPIPAYPVFPTTSFAYPTGVSFGINGNNGCGCCGSNTWVA